jgi:hypothetical protein
MGKNRLAFVAFDSAKAKHAVAIADEGRDGELRYLGEIDNSPDAVSKLVAKLSRQYERLHFCYEAGPTGVWAASTIDRSGPRRWGRWPPQKNAAVLLGDFLFGDRTTRHYVRITS